MQLTHEIIDADVLIIGSGCAGLGAALEAGKQNQRVVVVEKGQKSGRSGASIMALQMACAALALWDDDSPERHGQDTITWGRELSNPKIVRRMVEGAPERVLEFKQWGMQFVTREGKLDQLSAPGHRNKRALYVDFKNGTGRSMMQALEGQLRRVSEIKRIDNTCILELIVKHGEALGAVGFDISSGKLRVFRSKIVILATGGGMEVYGRNSASRNLSGDGYRLAYHAGASLQDMEFVQFMPMGTLYPHLPGMPMIIFEPLSYRTGGRLTNGLNEEFLAKYDSRGLNATRDTIAYAMAKEVLEGRGTPHGGVYFQPGAEGPEKMYDEYGPEFLERFKRIGVDISKETVEVYPIAHYFMGGIRTDEDGRTAIPGLYAVGESAGGVHGANRLAGNSLTEVMVLGQVVGECAGKAALSREVPAFDVEAVCGETGEKVLAMLNRPSDSEISAIGLTERLQKEMLSKAGPLRTGKSLKNALENVFEIERDYLPILGLADKNPVFSQELVDIFNLESMLATAKLVIQGALSREESRGAHRRQDFDEEESKWACNLILTEDPHESAPHVAKSNPVESYEGG